MASVIEIVDSDDNSVDDIAHMATPGDVLYQINDISKSSDNMDKNDLPNTSEVPPQPTLPTLPIVEAATGSNETTNESKSKRKHSRKSVHQPLRASPEIEFRTVSLTESTVKVKKPRRPNPKAREPDESSTSTDATMPVTEEADSETVEEEEAQVTPKRLKATSGTQQVSMAHARFHQCEKTKQILRNIAKERVRINYLLGLYGMPQMNFALKTQPERLLFQFEDRLKHWRLRHLDAVRLCPNNPLQRQTLSPSVQLNDENEALGCDRDSADSCVEV